MSAATERVLAEVGALTEQAGHHRQVMDKVARLYGKARLYGHRSPHRRRFLLEIAAECVAAIAALDAPAAGGGKA